MRGLWPFVARASELDRVRAASLRGSGLVVAGPAGVGKTRLVTEALKEITGLPVVHVCGTSAGTAIPLGAFAHMLPARLPVGGRGNLLRWAADAVAPDGMLLHVDDAHLLDATSAALVHHLVVHGRARLLATVRSGEPSPDPIMALWKNDLMSRLELAPLSSQETRLLLSRALGGQPALWTTQRLHTAAQGNVLFLRELVLTGQEQGRLRRSSQGVWQWQGELLVSSRLRELIETRLGDVDDAEREVLELVALGEPLDADILTRLVPSSSVDRAEARQLITTDGERDRLVVRLAHPLYGEAVRGAMGPFRTRSLLRRLAEAAQATGMRRRGDLVRVAVWQLDGEGAADPALLMEACLASWAAWDLDLAIRLGRAALDAGGGAAVAGVLGPMLFFTGQAAEAEAVLSRAEGLITAEHELVMHRIARAWNLIWGLGREAEAFRVLADATAATAVPALLQDILSFSAAFHVYAGRLREAEHDLDRARELGVPEVRLTAMLSAVSSWILLMRGRVREALALMTGTLSDVDAWRDQAPFVEHFLADGICMAHLFTGALDSAEAAAAERLALEGEFGSAPLARATSSAILGAVHRLRGQVQDARRWGADSVECWDVIPLVTTAPCRGELAHAAALTGDLEAARKAFPGDEESAPLLSFMAVGFPLLLARTWMTALAGDVQGAVECALAAADDAERHGLRVWQMFALHDVVRLGAARRVADRLAGLVELVDGELVVLCARHAAARTGKALDEVSADFERFGVILYAAEAAAQASLAHIAEGRERNARASAGRAHDLATRCQGAHTPALAQLSAPRLTASEWEIAQLAAGGLTNRQIAGQRFISIRTVSSHLNRVYHKLGVSDRAGLARRLKALGSDPPDPPPSAGPDAP
ncbi:LuxR C-terminal-related transcriptional regulator [Streptosporangium sp. NPDC000396]|uniref:LuxR C-terminal-related transcriptional regulator n=1 Tax=Streptosporangium sp. NPDC000396 TaxID=3366185 RepID=UPI0036C76EBD